MNNGYDYKHWRIPGVLQRFAVAYLVVGLVVIFIPKWKWKWTYSIWNRFGSVQRTSSFPSPVLTFKQFDSARVNYDSELEDSIEDDDDESYENMMKDKWVYRWFGDIVPFWTHWLVALSLLLPYFLITFELDVPGCGKGYLGPGGIGDYGLHFNCTGGAAGYIDKKIFGESHIYQYPTCKGRHGIH